MAKVTKSKILDAAQKNFDAIETKLSASIKKAEANKKNASTEIDATKALANWKAQFNKPLFLGATFTIPEKVYEAIAQKISSSLDKSFFSEKLSLNEGEQIKQIAAEISKILPNIKRETVPVDENGTTVNYEIDFGWEGVGVITVYKGNSSAILQAKNSTNWNEAVAKYSVALHQLGADTIAYAKREFRKAIKAGIKDYLKVLYGGTDSEWTKITKNTAFKKISAEYARTMINDFLTNVDDNLTKTNLSKYGTLAVLYNNLADAIGNRKSDATIKAAADKFSEAAKSILGSSFITLPDPANDFHYSANLTEVTIPAGAGSRIEADDYESKVKKIYATAYTSRVTINGNANANVIYGGSGVDVLYGGAGNDTIYGGKGNDSIYGDSDIDKLFGDDGNDTLIGGAGSDLLWGGTGKDVFYYAAGDGNDTILDYTSGQDLIRLGANTSVTGYSVKNGNALLTIGKSKITLKGVGDSDINIVNADKSTLTFGISTGLKYNNANLSDSTAVTITSNYNGQTFSAGYSSLVTITASARTKAIELVGNAKANRIIGGSGDDILNGGSGKDTILGGAGADTLIGGAGNDCLAGGAGNDVFYYESGDGADIIADFSTGDKIYIDGATSVSGSLKNSDVTFKIGSGSVKLTGAKNKEVSIEYSNGTIGKYLNGALVSLSRVTNIPNDALSYNGHYYKIYNEGLTWSDAKTFCENLGGHLVTITDANEQNAIENLLHEKGSKNNYWLGGFKDSGSWQDFSCWHWVTGEIFNFRNYGYYHSNDISTLLTMYCDVYDGYVTRAGAWSDIDVNEIGTVYSVDNFGLICEWDGGGVSGSSALFVDDNFISDDTNLDAISAEKFAVTNLETPSAETLAPENLITYAEKN